MGVRTGVSGSVRLRPELQLNCATTAGVQAILHVTVPMHQSVTTVVFQVILLLLAQWSHCVATARRLVTLQVSATVSQFATTVGSLDTLQRVVQLRKWEFPRHVSATTATDLDTLQWTVPMRRLATTVDSQDT